MEHTNEKQADETARAMSRRLLDDAEAAMAAGDVDKARRLSRAYIDAETTRLEEKLRRWEAWLQA